MFFSTFAPYPGFLTPQVSAFRLHRPPTPPPSLCLIKLKWCHLAKSFFLGLSGWVFFFFFPFFPSGAVMHFLSASWPFLPSFPLSWIGGLPRCPVLGCDVNAFLPMAFWETRKAQLRLPRAFLGARRCVLSHLHLFALARAGRGPVRKKCVLSLPSWGPSRPFSPLL